MLTRAVLETKMEILPHSMTEQQGYMDVSSFVQIKGVESEPGQVIELVQGIFLEKEFPIKHMLNTLNRPHIIVI